MTPCQTLETVTYYVGRKREPVTIPALGAWFPEGPHATDIAKRVANICATCPEQATCLAGAEARGETSGVWGGKHFKKPARPPKPQRSIPHGTRRGYQQHWVRGEDACAPCKQAMVAYVAVNRRRRREVVAA